MLAIIPLVEGNPDPRLPGFLSRAQKVANGEKPYDTTAQLMASKETRKTGNIAPFWRDAPPAAEEEPAQAAPQEPEEKPVTIFDLI